MNPKLDRDTFLVNQKHLTLGKSKYYVYDESGAPLFYVERPTMRLFGRRADITIFDDDTASTPVLLLRQDHGYEFRRREYTLVDLATDETLGRLCRDNLRALFRRHWQILDASGSEFAFAREDSTFMAFVRRAVDWIPYVSILGMAIRTDFHIFLSGDGAAQERKVGSFDRKFGLGDKYVLNLRDDPERRFDRRIALALGILLDTAEAR
jgi:uncharacterized protein YxjI